jgi:hypothetical protein
VRIQTRWRATTTAKAKTLIRKNIDISDLLIQNAKTLIRKNIDISDLLIQNALFDSKRSINTGRPIADLVADWHLVIFSLVDKMITASLHFCDTLRVSAAI